MTLSIVMDCVDNSYADVNSNGGYSSNGKDNVGSTKSNKKHKLGSQRNHNDRAINHDDNAHLYIDDAGSIRPDSINNALDDSNGENSINAAYSSADDASNSLNEAIRNAYANCNIVGASSKSKVASGNKKIRRTRKDKGKKRFETIKPDLYCEICNRHFTKRPNLLSHMQTHAQTITCETCGKQFRWRSTLLKHMLAHVGEIPNADGGTLPANVNEMSTRLNVAGNDPSGNVKDTNSSFCDALYRANGDSSPNDAIYNMNDTTSRAIFTSNNVLNPVTGKPKQTRTSTKKAHLRCGVCDRTFSKRPNMLSHMRIHDRTIACETCGKTFVSGVNLRQHMLTHVGWRPHKCDVCSKTFTQKGNLLKHLFAHTGERPHTCDFCGKSFGEKSHLKSHQLTHTGERPHTCETCCRSFADKSTLRRHAVTHTTERPYVCDICGRTFARKGYLTAHMLAHGGEKNFVCDVCSKAYARKKDLIKHLAAAHPECKDLLANGSLEDDIERAFSESSPSGGNISSIEHSTPDVCFSAMKTHEELCDIVSDSGEED